MKIIISTKNICFSINLILRSYFSCICVSLIVVFGVSFAIKASSLSSQNYISELKSRVKKADKIVSKAYGLFNDKNYNEALNNYKKALDILPYATYTESRRRGIKSGFSKSSIKRARQLLSSGDSQAAKKILFDVLRPSMDPSNKEALNLINRINHKSSKSSRLPSLSRFYKEDIINVRRAIDAAKEYRELGDYDKADYEYYKALGVDKYNTASVLGLQENEDHKNNHYRHVRDHTRGALLNEVARGWKLDRPRHFNYTKTSKYDKTTYHVSTSSSIENKLRNTIIPNIDFNETDFLKVVDIIRDYSRTYDRSETSNKGLNIVFGPGVLNGSVSSISSSSESSRFNDDEDINFGIEDAFGGEEKDKVNKTSTKKDNDEYNRKVTLRLNNASLEDVLRYTLTPLGLGYRVDSGAIVIVSLDEDRSKLREKTFRAPRSFLSHVSSHIFSRGGLSDDSDSDLDIDIDVNRQSSDVKEARNLLEYAGVDFNKEGSAAFFNKSTGVLKIINTEDQIDLVEAFLDSLDDDSEKQILIRNKFIEISQTDGDEISFDWLLGQVGNGQIVGSGGTFSNQSGATTTDNFTFGNTGGSPVTSGLRSGAQAVAGSTIGALLTGTSPSGPSPATFALNGVLTDPQFQAVIRMISQKKGVDVLSSPSLLVKPGYDKAIIEVVQEFIYPNDFSEPNVAAGSAVTNNGETTVIPGRVTPSTPISFATKNVGVTLKAKADIAPDGYTIKLSLAPEIVSFDGFINYGNPIANEDGGVLTENTINQPIFSKSFIMTELHIWDGHTVSLGGLIREKVQDIEDKIPYLGDLPAIGRLFRSSVEFKEKSNLTIFTTCNIQDPGGNEVNYSGKDKASNYYPEAKQIKYYSDLRNSYSK